MPKSVHMILQGWRRKPSTFKHRAWNLASSCLFWTLWRERNQRLLNGWELSMVKIKMMLLLSVRNMWLND